MPFLTSDGQLLDEVLMDASELRDELDGVDIKISAGKRGALKAAFVGDVSWMDADPKALAAEAVAKVKDHAIGKGWWHVVKGFDGQAIVGWR